MPASPTNHHQPHPQRHQLHLSDPPSSAESRTATFPAYDPIHRPDRENGNKITQVDLAALAPRSPDRLKAALQAQESPGWSFVMKNEDFEFQYPKKMSRSEEPPVFKRPSEDDKPRRHLLSFGRKKSKAAQGGSGSGSGSPGRNTPSPRPMMPSPKPRRFPPLSFNPPSTSTSTSGTNGNNRSIQDQSHNGSSAQEVEKSEDEEMRPPSFEPLNLSPKKMKPPPTPPKSQRQGRQTYPTPAHVPLPPSPDRDSRRERERERPQFRERDGQIEKDQPSPLERYFNPSPARAMFDRTSPSKRSHLGTPLNPDFELDQGSRATSALSHRMPTRQGLRDMLLASMDLLLEDHFITLESNHQAQTRRISHLERSTQDSSLALVQAQADYTALEGTLMEDRAKAESLSAELASERKLRKEQAEDATSLISQLEKQLSSQGKRTLSLEGRVGQLTQSLKESQGEIDRLEGEMTKGYTEMNGRLSNIGRLEKETGDWKRRAEEAEFTVKALREEGVRMSRELEKKGRIVEELEKGRKFVTRV